eukprot:INCI3271.1.p1 GENE.INCI3271.1~~INCI3271.1.p1  ORF type:complete len:585 (-),score=51.24 INCI3271.1:1076-2830(-)
MSSNEPNNGSREKAPNASEQQIAELQSDMTEIKVTHHQLLSDTTGIKDTQRQLQSDIAQIKSEIARLTTNITTIMGMLQSLTDARSMPNHRKTQATATPQQQNAEVETQPRQNTRVELKEPQSDDQLNGKLHDSKELAPAAQHRNSQRSSRIMPPAIQQLIRSTQSYQVKTPTFTDNYPDISLAPKKPQKVVDDIVYQMLRAVQPGHRVKPVSHAEIALPEAKDVNAVLRDAHDKLKQALMSQIRRCWKPKGNKHTFIDRYTTAKCIQDALELNYTHPLFIAQTLIEAIKDTPETSDLWRKIRREFMPQRSCRIIDKDGKPFHILDLYQLACQQSAGHNIAAQVAAERFQNYEQRGTDARTYIADKMDNLRALLALYDQLEDSSPRNTFITVAIMTALHNISEKANKPMRMAMTQDKVSAAPTLPWERMSNISYEALVDQVRAYEDALKDLAEAVDIEAERRASFGTANNRGARDNGNHNSSHTRNGGTKPSTNKRGKGINNKNPPDTTKSCTHNLCKRRQLPPHNAGQLHECGFLCRLQLQGIDCPNKGVNDYNGLHLFRDSCRKAWEQQKQDSPAGTQQQRR